MKKFIGALLVLCLIACVVPVAVFADAGSVTEDNVLDQVGDWFATIGKSGLDKDKILAERKAKRVAERATKAAEKAAKEAEKEAGKMKDKLLGS